MVGYVQRAKNLYFIKGMIFSLGTGVSTTTNGLPAATTHEFLAATRLPTARSPTTGFPSTRARRGTILSVRF